MSEALPPGTRLGPYEIETLIGAGGMGQVYRARDARLGRHVAIKTLSGLAAADPDRIRRFETEARAAGTLDHPNLLVIFDVGRQGTVSYIVSELLEGQTLRERLRAGAMAERQAIDCAAQIARGLAAAHGRDIVHRDLKPENIFLTRDRRVKILDFGVAKLVRTPGGNDATADAMTELGAVVGTVGYMAPEQIRAEPIDHRVDLFALGVVMHEMLAGAGPFRRDTAPETLTAILNDDAPELPSTVSPALARVVHRCLEKRREDRFHSAHDLGIALELLASGTDTAAAFTAPRAPGVHTRRQALIYGASSLALLAAGFAGGRLLDGSSPTSVPAVFRRLTFRRGLIRSARVAPDGQTILYGALWDGDRCRIHRVSVNSPESSPLEHVPEGNVLAISRSGEVALALGPHLDGVVTYGTLARVPLAGGAPRPMLEDVKFADWSPDGADLAIVRRVDGRDRLEFPIGEVLLQPATGEHTGLGFPRVSPDGRRVAFVHYQSPGSLVGRVAIVDRAGSVTALSDEYLNVHGLAWKGDEVWYAAADERPLFRALWATTPDGTRRVITRAPGNVTLWDAWPDGRLLLAHTDDRGVVIARGPEDVADRDLSWLDASFAEDVSTDGRWLLFTEYGQGAGPESAAYLRGMDGSAAVRLGSGRGVALSPDNQWAVCFAASFPSPYLELLPTGAGESRRLTDEGLAYTSARWLPDGRRLIVSALQQGHRSRLYLKELEGGQLMPLTPEGVVAWVVSPDGSTIAARGPGPEIRLYSVDRDDSRELPGMSGRETPVGWTTDGLLVRLSGDQAAPPGEIYRVDVATGRRELWRNVLPRDRAGIMALNSFRVAPDGRAHAYTWHRALSSLYVAEGLA
jgi:Tol biopolymer transport system component